MAVLRDVVVNTRLTPAEAIVVRDAAGRLGLTTSEYIRMVILGASAAMQSDNFDVDWNSTGRLVMSLATASASMENKMDKDG